MRIATRSGSVGHGDYGARAGGRPLERLVTVAAAISLPVIASGALAGYFLRADGAAGRPLILIGLLAAVGIGVGAGLSAQPDGVWFHGVGRVGDRLASGVVAVVFTTGVVALTSLAAAAAARHPASMQFLVLLSALDIAWTTSGTMIGTGWLFGRRVGVAAATVLAAVCVWSIWRYLGVVGVGPDGGWVVDGAALRSYVLPYDTMAAVITVAALVAGAPRAAST